MGKIIHNANELIGNTPLLELHNYTKAVQIDDVTILA